VPRLDLANFKMEEFRKGVSTNDRIYNCPTICLRAPKNLKRMFVSASISASMSEPQGRPEPMIEDPVESAEGDAMDCPLFMDGLPKNFSDNAALSALASLLDDNNGDGGSGDEQDDWQQQDVMNECKGDITTFEKEQTPTEMEKYSSSSGGGKARRMKSSRNHPRRQVTAPYDCKKGGGNPSKRQAKSNKPPPSVGESTLYLKLWKL
jgi:hypothetical protein